VVTPSPDLVIQCVGIQHPDALALIAEVQAEYVVRYGGPDDTPLDATMFDPPRGAFYVGYVAAAPAVTGAWRRHDPVAGVPYGPCAEIKRMYVGAAHRRLGLARVMLAHLETEARAAGAVTMILETGLRQPEAIDLYTSSGYLPIPGFGFYRDAPLSRCFAKPLTP
jgi:GNAT superfamily N-acetyltransferase